MLAPSPAPAVGAYDDLGRLSFFVRAPRERSLESRIYRTDAPAHDATLYYLAARFPLRGLFLLEIEVPYVSVISGGDVADGIGDARVFTRTALWSAPTRTLCLLGSVRLGSGKVTLFPYSTASVDFELGLGYADTLGTLSLWTSASAVYPTRVHDNLERDDLHERCAALCGGMVLPLNDRLSLQLGAAGYLFTTDASRSVVLAGADFHFSVRSTLFVHAQGELGSESDRAVDFALGVGVDVRY